MIAKDYNRKKSTVVNFNLQKLGKKKPKTHNETKFRRGFRVSTFLKSFGYI